MELKKLEAIVKLCRKAGIISITIEGVSLSLTAEAPKSSYKKRIAKAVPSSFETAYAQATDVATKAKLKYLSEQEKAKAQNKAETDAAGAPTELDMLFWSSGSGDGAEQS